MLDVDVDAGSLAARERAFADGLAVAADGDLGALAGDALVVETIGDGLGLPDDAEARRGGNRDAAIALVLVAGDQRMRRRLEAERAGVGGNVMHPSVGDQESVRDAVDGNARQRRLQRAEQMRAVGLAIGLTGIDDADFESPNLLQGVDELFL